jgi:hypothetical protein
LPGIRSFKPDSDSDSVEGRFKLPRCSGYPGTRSVLVVSRVTVLRHGHVSMRFSCTLAPARGPGPGRRWLGRGKEPAQPPAESQSGARPPHESALARASSAYQSRQADSGETSTPSPAAAARRGGRRTPSDGPGDCHACMPPQLRANQAKSAPAWNYSEMTRA